MTSQITWSTLSRIDWVAGVKRRGGGVEEELPFSLPSHPLPVSKPVIQANFVPTFSIANYKPTGTWFEALFHRIINQTRLT